MSPSRHVVLIYPQRDTLLFGVPLGIAYIAAVLRDCGCAVTIVDMRYEDERILFAKLREHCPDIIGFYCSSEIAPFVISLAEKIKREFKDAVLIAGGPHATLDPGYFLRTDFEVVVKGEGEITVKELVAAIREKRDLKDVRGIAYRSDGKIFDNPPREFIADLDDLPFPAFDLFPHVNDTFQASLAWPNLKPFTHIILSRGCPYQCTFCQPALGMMFGKKVRRLSPRRAIELLLFLKRRFDIKEIFFEDDLLLSRIWKDWLFELTDLMVARDLNIRWWAQARANSADRDILIQAQKAGCYMVMCGVESGSPKMLEFYNKATTPEDIRGFFRLCQELGLMSVAEIIFGAPEETAQDAEMTVSLMREVQPDMVWVSMLTPYPGTHLHEWLTAHKIKFENDLARLDRSMQRRRIDSMMSESELLAARVKTTQTMASVKKIFVRDYYRRAYLAKIDNLIANREYAGLLKLVFWTFLMPLTVPWQPMLFKYGNHAILRRLKKMCKV
jgi:radical SAM superfamily enzyme YgiQ (UPF0313 family)